MRFGCMLCAVSTGQLLAVSPEGEATLVDGSADSGEVLIIQHNPKHDASRMEDSEYQGRRSSVRDPSDKFYTFGDNDGINDEAAPGNIEALADFSATLYQHQPRNLDFNASTSILAGEKAEWPNSGSYNFQLSEEFSEMIKDAMDDGFEIVDVDDVVPNQLA